MALELVLDASVSLAWFLKETPDRATYAAAVSAAAAEGAVLHVPVQWGIEVGYVLPREHRRKLLSRAKLQRALEDLESFDVRTHMQGYDALYFDLASTLALPLATLDDGHRQAAAQFGVKLFLPPPA